MFSVSCSAPGTDHPCFGFAGAGVDATSLLAIVPAFATMLRSILCFFSLLRASTHLKRGLERPPSLREVWAALVADASGLFVFEHKFALWMKKNRNTRAFKLFGKGKLFFKGILHFIWVTLNQTVVSSQRNPYVSHTS